MMAASVRIEDEAFVDPRIELLGSIAGYNRFEALGRLAHLWRVCTARETYILPESFVTACLGPKGTEALAGSGLGEKADGGYRIKGTAERIEWLKIRRAASKAGGEANKTRLAAEREPQGSRRKPRGSRKVAEGSQEDSQNGANTEPSDIPPTASPTASPDLPSEDVCVGKPQTHTPFRVPNLEEVTAYCTERKNSVDPAKFIDFYSSKGWMIGKNKMKDWQASVRTWEKGEQNGTVTKAKVLTMEELLAKYPEDRKAT